MNLNFSKMISSITGSLPKLINPFAICLILLLFSSSTFTSSVAEAYNAVDQNANITIKWDALSWTPNGYVAIVTMYNYQKHRTIRKPGWRLGWTWAKKEVIWSIIGAKTIDQGDCSKYRVNIPNSCKKNPTVVDLSPGVPYNQQIANCCKGGVLSSWGKDPSNAVSAFQISIGASGNSEKTVKLPKNFTLEAPGGGYTCGPAKVVVPTRFISADKRRMTRALMTWNVTCTYSLFWARKIPSRG